MPITVFTKHTDTIPLYVRLYKASPTTSTINTRFRPMFHPIKTPAATTPNPRSPSLPSPPAIVALAKLEEVVALGPLLGIAVGLIFAYYTTH